MSDSSRLIVRESSDIGRTQRVVGRLARNVPWLLAPIVRIQRWLLAHRDPSAALALARRLPEATFEPVDSDHLGALCVAAPRALAGPTAV